MRSLKILAIFLIFLIAFTGCSNNASNPDDGLDVGADGLIVKGNFENQSSNLQGNSLLNEENNTEVGSVVLIKSESYKVINIEDNEFALELDRKTPSAIAFIDENDQYLGYLRLVEGMSSFPTQAIDEETNIIDLGKIDFTGDEAVPEYNPIEDENQTGLTPSDLDTLAVSDSFFSAVATSSDLIDLLINNNQEIRLGISYFGSHNNFDENGDTFPSNTDLKLKTHRIFVRFSNPLTDTFQDLSLKYPNENLTVEAADVLGKEPPEATEEWVNFPGVGDIDRAEVEGPTVPEAGEYVINDKQDLNFSFNIPELKVVAEEHLIVPLPQIELYENEEGYKMIDSISWEYYNTNKDPINNPEYILEDIGVQLSAHPKKLDQLKGDYDLTGEETRIYDQYHQDVTNQRIDLRDQEIYWEDLYVVDMAYNDLYGIHYLVPFAHPNYQN